jgi:hypothetical protein
VDAIVAALIGGVFMLVNSALTIWLTKRLTRPSEDQTPPKDPEPPS